MSKYSLKKQIGCWVHERKDTELAILAPRLAASLGRHWLDLHNRSEQISIEAVTGGRICHWTDSSPLTVARMFPRVGARLLRRCLTDWPIEFSEIPAWVNSTEPEVSFLVAVRGTKRLPQFRAVLASLLAQVDCACEIVVVEQSEAREFESILPSVVRYIHTPPPTPDMPFNKSWALNVGARLARGRILIVQDADMAVPMHYAKAIRDTLDRGYDGMRVPRFLFYLTEEDTQIACRDRNFGHVRRIERVIQNNPTPVALRKDAYFQIGGHDEAFYAWGGEDNEFLDRLQTLRTASGTCLPIVHLWHPEAPNRTGDRNREGLEGRRRMPVAERIRELSARAAGREAAPNPLPPPRHAVTEAIGSTA